MLYGKHIYYISCDGELITSKNQNHNSTKNILHTTDCFFALTTVADVCRGWLSNADWCVERELMVGYDWRCLLC